MIQVAPSMLAADFLRLEKDVELVNRCGDIFHLDIMDGTFVPNISYGFPIVHAIACAARRPMDVYLMFVNPGNYVERFAREGVSMLSFHLEAAGEDTEELLGRVRSLGMKAGLAINPDIPVDRLFPYLDSLDYVLIMSVFAGFGGQKFIEDTLGRIKTVKREIRRRKRDVLIEVDGGIGPDNAPALSEAGADILVAGSSVFKAEDPDEAIRCIRVP